MVMYYEKSDMISRRLFIISSSVSLVTAGLQKSFGAGSTPDESLFLYSGPNRLILRAIHSAFPNLASDTHVSLASKCKLTASSSEENLGLAFGLSLAEFLRANTHRLRQNYLRAKDRDYRALNVLQLDGYILARSELALGNLLSQIDPA